MTACTNGVVLLLADTQSSRLAGLDVAEIMTRDTLGQVALLNGPHDAANFTAYLTRLRQEKVVVVELAV